MIHKCIRDYVMVASDIHMGVHPPVMNTCTQSGMLYQAGFFFFFCFILLPLQCFHRSIDPFPHATELGLLLYVHTQSLPTNTRWMSAMEALGMRELCGLLNHQCTRAHTQATYIRVHERMHEHTWIRMQVWHAHMCHHMCPLFDAGCACGRLQFSNFVARLSCAADRRWSLISDLDKFFQSISFFASDEKIEFFFVNMSVSLFCLPVYACLYAHLPVCKFSVCGLERVQPGAVKLVLWRHWMHAAQVHSVTSENHFHYTILYSQYSRRVESARIRSKKKFFQQLISKLHRFDTKVTIQENFPPQLPWPRFQPGFVGEKKMCSWPHFFSNRSACCVYSVYRCCSGGVQPNLPLLIDLKPP